MFGYTTTYDDPESGIATVLDSEDSDDCVRLSLPAVTVEYVHDDTALFNVTGAGQDRTAIRRSVTLTTEETGVDFLILKSEAESQSEVIAEVEEIIGVVGHDLSDVQDTTTFTAAKPTLIGNLKSLLGIGA